MGWDLPVLTEVDNVILELDTGWPSLEGGVVWLAEGVGHPVIWVVFLRCES